jgi:hypothetical protein
VIRRGHGLGILAALKQMFVGTRRNHNLSGGI